MRYNHCMRLAFRILFLVFLACGSSSPPPAAVPPPRPGPLACFNICSSNAECSFGILQRCPFCSFGTCSGVRPELKACQQACAPNIEPRPVWCDIGECGAILRAAAR
jgi:hypothetical protein